MRRSHNPDDVDPWLEEAERMTKDWERNPFSGAQSLIGTPELRAEYVQKLADLLRESSGAQQASPRAQEPDEKPFSSDEFWKSDEPKQYTRKKL